MARLAQRQSTRRGKRLLRELKARRSGVARAERAPDQRGRKLAFNELPRAPLEPEEPERPRDIVREALATCTPLVITYRRQYDGATVQDTVRPYEAKNHRTSQTPMLYATHDKHGATQIHSYIIKRLRVDGLAPVGSYRPVWPVQPNSVDNVNLGLGRPAKPRPVDPRTGLPYVRKPYGS